MPSTTTTRGGSAGRTILGVTVHGLGLVFGIFGPGLVYLLSRGEFSKANARNALTWQLFVLVGLAGLLAVFFTTDSDPVGLAAGGLLLALLLVDAVASLWATVKAIGGEAWSYPLVSVLG
ncbi:hypothetical protein SAMN05216559_0377 [Halomicrobium zhouii]|uniref:DUF4870 domain-containing protein n=1 Tax=Halomicrobium zhouii TaxID=767519 RepID=A0A1I6K8N5_9EURY|nr:DUF4870 domain-containing protein [Halomicrobium zhouii]SFR87579.1 hypothetical protein SAMN05216559_0377 [Halomicrobium zhouii]